MLAFLLLFAAGGLGGGFGIFGVRVAFALCFFGMGVRALTWLFPFRKLFLRFDGVDGEDVLARWIWKVFLHFTSGYILVLRPRK